jgi:serine/threonine protein kinase
MTDFEQLKQQIEQYVRTGMTESKRQQLISQAGRIGINPGQLVMLIKNAELELKFATGVSNTDYPTDLGSGFMMEPESPGSGFIVENDPYAPKDSEGTQALVAEDAPAPALTSAPDSSEFTEIKKLEDQGAMSDVYSALHLGRRKVIIKRIKPQYRYNSQYIDLFYKEFDTGYSLENPGVVHFYGKGEDAEGPYYYMEYVDGRTLHDFIHVEQNTKEDVINKIVLQLLDALKYMHQKQVFHRDLKPENIMLTYKGNNVKIIDFGLAAADSLVDNLAKAGTPKYAAPELMNRATDADQRSDIYALGIIIIEMFTRHPDRRYLSQMQSEKFRQVADKCTMLNPNDRYQSCDEILRVLLASGNSNPMPPWLEAKIKEYAADGVITRNERAVLDKEIAKAGVDRDLAEAIISDEIEKAISRKRKEELDRRNRMSQTSTKLEDEGGGGRKFVKILILLIVLAAVGTVLYMYYDKGHWPWEQPTTSQQGNSNDNYFAPGQIVYTTTNVNLRMLADKDSKLLMTVAKNKPVEVVSDGYFWVEVRVDNKRGYMAKQYLSHTQTK